MRKIIDIRGIVDEDYETGDLTQYEWATGGNAPWFVSTSSPYEGAHCSQSGAISDDQNSTMSIDWDAATNDSISFYRKVSCENGSASGSQWDFLEFLIDATSKDWWDGEKSWSRVAYAVTAGQHTFTWKYAKDNMVADGSDAAWVDYIVFPPLATTTGCEELSFGFNIYPNPATELMFVDVNLAHVDVTFHAKVGCRGCNRNSVLACTRLCYNFLFSHELCKQTFSHAVIELVRARVV